MLFSGVNEEEFEIHRQFELKGVIYHDITLKNRGYRCMGCGSYHTSIKEYRTKKIKISKDSIILYHQRRFVCPVCHKTHMEDNPFNGKEKKFSASLVVQILEYLKRYNHTFLDAAEYFGMTGTEVIRIFDRYCQMERNPLSKIVCFDEIYFSRKRRKKYILVLLNFKNRAILDVLKDRDRSTLVSYLRKIDRKERQRVRYVCTDMNEIYREVIKIFLPEAIHVADSFHVVKNVSKMLDDVRKRILRRYSENKRSDEYYLLKYKDELLYVREDMTTRFSEVRYNHHFHYEISDQQKLHMMLELDKDLKSSYELYHRYMRFNDTDYKDISLAENELNDIINELRVSGIKECEILSGTLDSWSKEIINSFRRCDGIRVSNGPMEGRNSYIKKILKLANGYDSFERFRNRIIYSLNKMAKHSFMAD